MVAGESMYHEEEEPDEDYFDPHYLHTAAELYDMQNQRDGGGVAGGLYGMMGAGHPAEMIDSFPGVGHPADMEFEYGRNFDPFGEFMKAF